MNTSPPSKGITPRYAKQFECLGSSCPDTCCQGWSVNMDRITYERLQQLLPPEQLTAHLRKGSNANAGGYATIVMNTDGYCPFFDPADHLCTLHKQHGAACLSQICRQYPRQLSMIGDTLEQGLNISCPEAARRCLLDESAMELVEFDPALTLQRGIGFYHMQSASPPQRYFSYLNDLREIMLQLLANRNIPFASRLFAALYFSRQISHTLHEGAKQVDDGIIIQELEQMLAPGYMDDLHQQFESLPHTAGFSMSLLQNIIMARLHYQGAMSALIPDILRENGITLGSDVMEIEENSELSRAFERMLERYQQRRNLLRQTHGAALDQYFENYSRNFWLKDLFIKSPSLFNHMQNLIVRLAVVKFLLICHPQMSRLLDSAAQLTAAEMKKGLDEVAVSAFYQFSRIVEHDKQFMARIHTELGRQQMDSFAHLVLLLKF